MAEAKLSKFRRSQDAPMVSDPPGNPRHAHHTHIYTHTYKLTHLMLHLVEELSESKGTIIHSCKGLQTGGPLHSHITPTHVIHRTPQMIINHAHCITVTLSFIYETPRKSGSHITAGLQLLLPPTPGPDPLSLR